MEDIKKDMFKAFETIQNMEDIPHPIKSKMLRAVLEMNPNHWRVVGITKKAIISFKEHNYRYKARMGINRSHIFPRYKRNKYLLDNNNWDIDGWWNYFYSRDKCILATSTENMNNEQIVSHCRVPRGLFMSYGYRFAVTEKEIKFLQKAYKGLNIK
jgi:hypothetical protein